MTKLTQKLRIVIPANAGGGWDATGRAIGAAMVATGVVDEVEYENKGGKGGTLGLAHYVERYSDDPNALLVGGMVMAGAVALLKPAVDMSRVRPIARLTSEYSVVVVTADSPIRSVQDLAARFRNGTKNVPIAGGSIGGVDHLFGGLMARSAGGNVSELVFHSFSSGGLVDALRSAKAVVGISDYGQFSEHLARGELRAIGVSARKSLFGIPSVREQGLDVDLANWRGLLTGASVPAMRQVQMVAAVAQAITHPTWLQTLKQNRWESSWLPDKQFGEFIDLTLLSTRVMVYLLKLKAT